MGELYVRDKVEQLMNKLKTRHLDDAFQVAYINKRAFFGMLLHYESMHPHISDSDHDHSY
jgi:hypothetical protein